MRREVKWNVFGVGHLSKEGEERRIGSWNKSQGSVSILWPSDVKSWLKTLMLGKIEGRRRRGRQRMRWLDGINGHKFEQTLQDSKGQGNLECCSPWGCKELDTTEWLNNSILIRMRKGGQGERVGNKLDGLLEERGSNKPNW